MQKFPFALDASTPARDFNAAGNLFVYQSGTSAGSAELVVQSDMGGEMEVLPGQRFRLPGNPTKWNIRVKDGVSTVSGKIVIGSGEYDDNNSVFVNAVSISNTAASRVPVQIDPAAPLLIGNTTAQRVPVQIDPAAPLLIGNTTAQRVPVNIDPTAPILIGNNTAQRVPVAIDPTEPILIGNTTASRVPVAIDPAAPLLIGNGNAQRVPVVNVCHDMTSWVSTSAAKHQVVAQAANVNGILIYAAWLDSDNSGNALSLVAKAGTLPNNNSDGDCVLHGCANGTDRVMLPHPVRIAAGKGLYIYSGTAGTGLLRHVIYALL